MSEFELPLRLARYSQPRESGRGCAMNVISWENGDEIIVDHPSNVEGYISALVQQVNDNYCTHMVDGLLCPPCSTKVLRLAHLAVGTEKLLLIGNLPQLLEGFSYRVTQGGYNGRYIFSGIGIHVDEMNATRLADRERFYQIVETIIMRARAILGLPAEHQIPVERTRQAIARMEMAAR